MPTLKKDNVLWVQIAMTDASGKTWWSPKRSPRMDSAPLERRGTTIKFDSARSPKNSIKIDTELESSTAGNGSNSVPEGLHARLTESRKPLPDGGRLDLKIDDFDRGTLDFKPMWSLDDKGNKALRDCPLGFTLAADGHVANRSESLLDPNLSPKIQAEDYLARTVNAIEATTLSLPAAAVMVNDTWKATFPFAFPIGSEPDTADVELVCTYDGIRNVEGKDRAVVSALGTLRPRKGVDSPILFGKAQAIFQVDPSSGCVLEAQIRIVADYITPTRKRRDCGG